MKVLVLIFSSILYLSNLSLSKPSQGSLRFIENKKQWDPSELFRADIPNGKVIFKKNSIHYLLYDISHLKHQHQSCVDCEEARLKKSSEENVKMHHVQLTFDGGTANKVSGRLESDQLRNYFLGSNPERWSTDVRSFSEIHYNQIYPGVDLRFYSEGDLLKYDLLIAPGADLEQVSMVYEGTNYLKLAENSLLIGTSLSQIEEAIPESYQVHNNDTSFVKIQYQLKNNKVSLRIKDGYDKKKTLIIDPLLIFSTYSGSVSDNWGNTATFDEEGNLYSGGITSGPQFPATPGAYETNFSGAWDVAILKYDSTGSNLLYATYLGGEYAETPQSLVVNSKNELLILGATSSPDFPMRNSFEQNFKGGDPVVPLPGVEYENGSDLFIAKLSGDGTELLGSTFLGGTGNDGINVNFNQLVKNYGDQYRGDIFVDPADRVYIASNTRSSDFPVLDAFQQDFGGGPMDGVVFSLTEDLSELLWSSYFGGNGSDAVYSLKVNPAGDILVAGGTTSFDLPATDGALQTQYLGEVDGFVARIRQQPLTLTNCTYLGTTEYDQAYFVDLDQAGAIYVFGQTAGDYPEVAFNPATPELVFDPGGGQFLHKLNLELTNTLFSTNFGNPDSNPDISLTAFLVNKCGYIFMSGWGGGINGPQDPFGSLTGYIGGNTQNLPLSNDAFQNTTDGSDFYLIVLRENAESLLYATYFGGVGNPGEHVDGGTSRFDKDGIVYQAVCADCGVNSNNTFPTTEGAWSRTNQSPNCNNAAFKFDLASLNADFTTNSVAGDDPGLNSGCFPLEVLFLNKSVGGKTFLWDFGNGVETTQKDSVVVSFDAPGFYNVTLVALDINTCKQVDVASGIIRVYDQDFTISDDLALCFGQSGRLSASGGDTYNWSPVMGLNDPAVPDPIAAPDQTTTYYLEAINGDGCAFNDSVLVVVNPEIDADFSYQKIYNCDDFPQLVFKNLTENADSYIWDFGDGVISSEIDPVHQYQSKLKNNTYNVRLKAVDDECEDEISRQVSVRQFLIPNVFTPNPEDDFNETFTINSDAPIKLEVFNRWGVKVFESDNYDNQWTGSKLASGVYYYKATIIENGQACFGWVDILK